MGLNMNINSQIAAKYRFNDQVIDATTQTEAPVDLSPLLENAEASCNLLKSMAHEGRLVILCLLSQKERSVMELEESLELRQPAVSQQLARLRADNLVSTRRDGKMIYYSLASNHARSLIHMLANFYAKN